MPTNNIKISELNSFPVPIIGEDFLPLVDSSSMTTYEASMTQVATAMAALNPNAAFATRALFATSASWASRSLSASRADDVSLYGNKYSFPYWNDTNINGDLQADTPLYVSFSGRGIITIDSASAFYAPTAPYIPARPDYTLGGYWNPNQNFYMGDQSIQPIASGLFSYWPIVSSTFIGTDQSTWVYQIGSHFWNGNSATGVDRIVGDVGYETIDKVLNKNWVRIASMGYFDAVTIADNTSKGEVPIPTGGFYGKIRLVASGNNGSDGNQIIEFDIHDQIWDGGIVSDVLVGSVYGKQIIQKIRLSVWHDAGPNYNDPMMSLDVYIDNLVPSDTLFKLTAQSWGGVKFLTVPNVAPANLVNVGSVTPEQASYLVFPPASGHYTTLGNVQDYNIAGQSVVINPNRNQIISSDKSVNNPYAYALQVNGQVNADTYYAKTQQGHAGTFVAYDTISSGWYKMNMDGGILINSSSTTPPAGIGGGVLTINTTATGNITIDSSDASVTVTTVGNNVNLAVSTATIANQPYLYYGPYKRVKGIPIDAYGVQYPLPIGSSVSTPNRRITIVTTETTTIIIQVNTSTYNHTNDGAYTIRLTINNSVTDLDILTGGFPHDSGTGFGEYNIVGYLSARVTLPAGTYYVETPTTNIHDYYYNSTMATYIIISNKPTITIT